MILPGEILRRDMNEQAWLCEHHIIALHHEHEIISFAPRQYPFAPPRAARFCDLVKALRYVHACYL